VLGAVVIFRDVTARKKLEERLIQSERLASLGSMAAGMGHEINNPLAAVVGNLGIGLELLKGLQQSLNDPLSEAAVSVAELLEVLTDANDAANRVRCIVHDLRKFASVQNNPASMRAAGRRVGHRGAAARQPVSQLVTAICE